MVRAMAGHSQYGHTLLLDNLKGSTGSTLKRVRLQNRSEATDGYNEAWIQGLLMKYPGLLPVAQIEPAFADLVPICVELPVGSGFLDNLLITPSGDLALIECKLWRNPEARRKVNGQIIDYASEMSKWTYEELEAAIRRTKAPDGLGGNDSRSLYDRIAGQSELQEAAFVDRVSRNLRLGRFLLLIVGDGIQEGVETMTEFLQQHAGLHFTLGLVELAFFEMPAGGYLAQPRILAKTTNIYRGIVAIDDGRIAVRSFTGAAASPIAPGRPVTITKEQYLEELGQKLPGIAPKLDSFADKLEHIGVALEFGKSMILRWRDEEMTSWNLGTIPPSGEVWLESLNHRAIALGSIELSRRYLTRLAAIVPGALVRQTPKPAGSYVALDGKPLSLGALLENDKRQDQWVEAIEELQKGILDAERSR